MASEAARAAAREGREKQRLKERERKRKRAAEIARLCTAAKISVATDGLPGLGGKFWAKACNMHDDDGNCKRSGLCKCGQRWPVVQSGRGERQYKGHACRHHDRSRPWKVQKHRRWAPCVRIAASAVVWRCTAPFVLIK